MKKILSLVVAILMLVTMTLSAFAVTLNSATTAGSHDILTKEDKADGTSGVYWEVTYDATTTLPWETLVDSKDAIVEYSAETHLRYNETLEVSVATSADSKMVHTSDSSYTLAYSLKAANGVDALETTELANVDSQTVQFRVDIPLSEWNASPAGEYKDVLTFKAEVKTAN